MSQLHATHRSSISQHSQHSRSVSAQEAFELSDEELIQLVNEATQQNKLVIIENEILEKTIMRLDPALMQGVQQALELATTLMSNSSLLNVGSFTKSQVSKFNFGDSMISPSKNLLSPSRASTRRIESSAKLGGTFAMGTGPRINVLERSELVTAEMEILIINLEKVRQNAARQQAYLKAQLEEVGIKLVDIDKAVKMFQQDVIVDGWDKIAQRIPAEIWIRFMTEWVKICDSIIGKLRLRTSTLNTQHRKLKSQIRVKAELSESLRPVDFEKLKIENAESLKMIDKKLLQLKELKKMTGDANLNLTLHKKAMMVQNNYLQSILSNIKEKQYLTVQLDKESNVIELQVEKVSEQLKKIKDLRMAWLVPDIMDYVRMKSEMTDLKNVIKTLENRLHIKQIALGSLARKLNAMAKDSDEFL